MAEKAYDYNIGLIRVLALAIILVLHLLQSNGYETASFPWFCGVPLFLIISGYLYGQHFVKLLVPYYLLLFVNIIVALLYHTDISIINIVKGLLYLPSCNKNILGMAHTWYLTYILICYLTVPALHSIFDRMAGGIFRFYAVGGIMISVLVATELVSKIQVVGNLSSVQINLFVGAFLISKFYGLRDKKYIGLIFLGCGILLTVLIQLVLHVNSYNQINALLRVYLDGTYTYIFFGILLYGLSFVKWERLQKIKKW